MRMKWFNWIRNVWMKHKVSILDLGAIAAAMLVAAYFAFSVDVFVTEGAVPEKTLGIELDELIALGGMLMLGLLVFSIRRYAAQKREIARRTKAEHQARELAYQDPLTGLPNRRQFNEALDIALKSPAGSQAVHALFLLDLNDFKRVNDIHGHAMGDQVLVIVAQRLSQVMREGDLVARLGGDEFGLLSQHLMGPEAAATIAQRIMQALDEPITSSSGRHVIGVGIGIALLADEDRTETMRRADVALYRAKAERRSAFRFFDEEMDQLIRERDRLERDLRQALDEGRICASFRPTIDLGSREIVGFEALPRWIDSDGQDIPAMRFVPIAEETGQIHRLAEAVLRSACQAAASWPARISLSIDIYPSQLTDPALTSRILGILAETQLDTARLEVEITESAIVQNLRAAKGALTSLHDNGIRIALDNFGTGYSTLYHLREFKLDRIKIDRSFVESTDPQSRKVLSALAGLGHGLGLAVSADGVGSRQDAADLTRTGIEQGQDDAFGRSLSPEETESALAKSFAGAPRKAG
jgi:diguanylate cyclase (GGDEF)-like protein